MGIPEPSRPRANRTDHQERWRRLICNGLGAACKLRAAILEVVSAEDVAAIIEQLIRKARDGDITAAREILDRKVGKSAQSNLLERIEALEAIAAQVDTGGVGGNREP